MLLKYKISNVFVPKVYDISNETILTTLVKDLGLIINKYEEGIDFIRNSFWRIQSPI